MSAPTRFLRPIPAAIFMGAGKWQDVLLVSIAPGEKLGTMRVETVDHGPWDVDAKGLRCDHEAARAAAAEAMNAKIGAKIGDTVRSIIGNTARLVREKAKTMDGDARTRAEAAADALEGES